MPPSSFKKFFIVLLLCSLAFSAFYVRLENFNRAEARSIDEQIYYHLGKQLKDDIRTYNSIPYGNFLKNEGRDLPNYFFQPLFKYPPLFAALIGTSMKIFGETEVAAEYVSLVMNLLCIFLVYLLGALLFDRRVALVAAIILWIDPINMICSQKIWLGTTIEFFTLLSVWAFCHAIKNQKNRMFLIAGLCSGLAASTKYTGILPTLVYVVFALTYKRELFKNKYFMGGLFIPFLVLIPWILWNVSVYGWGLIDLALKNHPHILLVFDSVNLMDIAFLAVGCFAVYRLIQKLQDGFHRPKELSTDASSNNVSVMLGWGIFIIFLIPLASHISDSLMWNSIPKTSWGNSGFREDSTPLFYFYQSIRFSLFYFFSFMGLLLYRKKQDDGHSILRLSSLIILSVFILWGNYQSRYILPITPFLILLGAEMMVRIFDQISSFKSPMIQTISRTFYLLLTFYFFLKVNYINAVLSFPHDFCYF